MDQSWEISWGKPLLFILEPILYFNDKACIYKTRQDNFLV